MKLSINWLKKSIIMGFLTSIGCIIAQIAITQTAFAQSNADDIKEVKPLKQYDIEIILFKNIKVPKGSEKILPAQAPQMDEIFISFANQDDITSATELGFIIPDENEYRLSDIVKKIKRSSRYQFLKHMVWRQPGLAKQNAIAVQIRTGKLFGNDYSSIDSPVKPLLTTEELEVQQLDITKPIQFDLNTEEPELVWYELEGKITITLARYLHAYVDMVLRVPSENTIILDESNNARDKPKTDDELSFTSATLNNFTFKEHRRMRSRKLHYLDHPEVGMLILITPYEEPEKIEFIEDINKL